VAEERDVVDGSRLSEIDYGDEAADGRMVSSPGKIDGGHDEFQAGSGRAEIMAMSSALGAIEPLDQGSRARVLQWLTDVLGVETAVRSGSWSQMQSGGGSADLDATDVPTPREFVSRKKPVSQVERVACLAYYLTQYRRVQYFKAMDIAALNTEAAAPKFGNVSRDLDNADRQYGYVVSSGNGSKQLTVRGEAVVLALPDRDAVEMAAAEHPHKRKRPSSASRKSGQRDGEDQ
jgi:hypothetical protein